MTIRFQSSEQTGLIILPLLVDGRHWLSMILDTGATHTTIDFNTLYILGYRNSSQQEVLIETANGIVPSQVLLLPKMECLGQELYNFPVQAYDFLAHGIASEYDGILGMDVLAKRNFCIDFTGQTIQLS